MKKIRYEIFLYKIMILFFMLSIVTEACDRFTQGTTNSNSIDDCDIAVITFSLCRVERVAQGCSDCGACSSVAEGDDNTVWLLPAHNSCDDVEKPYLKQGENICVSTLTPLPQEAIDVQNRHNQLRAEVYSGGEIAWSVEVAASAQACVDSLAQSGEFSHCASGYGEKPLRINKRRYIY